MRMLDIGFTYDSTEDDARVTLVHSYAGTQTVTAFAPDSESSSLRMGDAGKIDQDGIDTDESPELALTKASGTFLEATNLNADGSDRSAVDAEAVDLYYFTDPEDDMKKYVREAIQRIGTSGTGVTTYTYAPVSIRAGAQIPDAAEYSHLHFGVWAGLSGDDENEVADLGIGFVANIGEMTSNMPNFGTAKYEGNWVANVQEKDGDGDGDITRRDGAASMDADFGEGDVDVMLTGLASLEGTIDGNTFSGTEAALLGTAMTDEPADLLDAEAEFEGNFSGAFFGNLGAEAGGVFDFASDDDNNEGGAFRGAFGADQKPPPAQ